MRFIFVDEILEMIPGKSIRAQKKISAKDDYFRDHFPGFPVVPGVLQIEMMAQAAGKCLDAEKKRSGKAMLARINSANFREWIGPDRVAIIHAEITLNREKYATAKCDIEVMDKRVSSAELFFTFVPLNNFASDYVDEVLESYLSKNQ